MEFYTKLSIDPDKHSYRILYELWNGAGIHKVNILLGELPAAFLKNDSSSKCSNNEPIIVIFARATLFYTVYTQKITWSSSYVNASLFIHVY